MEGFIDITSLNIPEEVRIHDMKIKQKNQSNTQPVNNEPNYGQFQQFKAPLEQYIFLIFLFLTIFILTLFLKVLLKIIMETASLYALKRRLFF